MATPQLAGPGCCCDNPPQKHCHLIRAFAAKRAGAFQAPPEWAWVTDKTINDATTHAALVDEFYAFLEAWYFQFAAIQVLNKPDSTYHFNPVTVATWGSILQPSANAYELKFANFFNYYHSNQDPGGTNWVQLLFNVDQITHWNDDYHLTNSIATDYHYDLAILPGAANDAVTETGTHSGYLNDYPGLDQTDGALNETGVLRWKATWPDGEDPTAEIWYTHNSTGYVEYWRMKLAIVEAGLTASDMASLVDGWLDTVQLNNLAHGYADGVYNPDGTFQGTTITWDHDYEVCYAFQDGEAKIALDDISNPLNIMSPRIVLIDRGENIDRAAGSPHFGMWVTELGTFAKRWDTRTSCLTTLFDERIPGAGLNSAGAAMHCRIGRGADGYQVGYYTQNQAVGAGVSGAYPGTGGQGYQFDASTDCNTSLDAGEVDYIFTPADMIYTFGVAWVGAECRMSYVYYDPETGDPVPYDDGLAHCTCVIGLAGEGVCTTCIPTM